MRERRAARGVLLRPLPCAEPDRRVRSTGHDEPTGSDETRAISLVDSLAWWDPDAGANRRVRRATRADPIDALRTE